LEKRISKEQTHIYISTQESWVSIPKTEHILLKNAQNCGYVHRDNRQGERFICIKCGFKEDADVNGALNILSRKYDQEISLYTPYKQVKEILLKRYSVGAIKPPRLEKLNLNGCGSYKQPIQEQNIILATGGESSLSS